MKHLGGIKRLALIGVVLLSAVVLVYVYYYPYRAPSLLQLPDGSEAWMRGDSTLKMPVDFPKVRVIDLRGEVLLQVAPGARPLLIRTPLLKVTAPGVARLVLTSFPNDVGAQMEVLEGAVDVERAYPSSVQELDHVVAGETAVVSRAIDLLEHDSMQERDLPPWTKRYLPAVVAGSSRREQAP